MNRIVKSLAVTSAAVCAGVVLVGAPSQAAPHHHHAVKAATSQVDVQVQFLQSTYNPGTGDLCVTFYRTRTSPTQVWVEQPWHIGVVAQGACGTPVSGVVDRLPV